MFDESIKQLKEAIEKEKEIPVVEVDLKTEYVYHIYLTEEAIDKQPVETFEDEIDCLKFIKDHFKGRKDVVMIKEERVSNEKE